MCSIFHAQFLFPLRKTKHVGLIKLTFVGKGLCKPALLCLLLFPYQQQLISSEWTFTEVNFMQQQTNNLLCHINRARSSSYFISVFRDTVYLTMNGGIKGSFSTKRWSPTWTLTLVILQDRFSVFCVLSELVWLVWGGRDTVGKRRCHVFPHIN